MTAENFMKKHFNGIEKETWYPAIVALAEGYKKQELKSTERKLIALIKRKQFYTMKTAEEIYKLWTNTNALQQPPSTKREIIEMLDYMADQFRQPAVNESATELTKAVRELYPHCHEIQMGQHEGNDLVFSEYELAWLRTEKALIKAEKHFH